VIAKSAMNFQTYIPMKREKIIRIKLTSEEKILYLLGITETIKVMMY
jgi:hypothetical protein